MALINCPECKKEISSTAISCPSCGYPLQEQIKVDDFRCPHCKGHLVKSKEATSGGTGCIVIILGLVLTPILIGIPIILYGLHLGSKRRGLWVCRKCGYQFKRKLNWYEFG